MQENPPVMLTVEAIFQAPLEQPEHDFSKKQVYFKVHLKSSASVQLPVETTFKILQQQWNNPFRQGPLRDCK